MNLAVAYTEYQLIQIQALIYEYKLKDVYLITFQKKRIPEWLLNRDLYSDICFLPAIDIPRWNRLTKSFIEKYYSIIEQFLRSKDVQLLIGAQDENTIYAVIKLLANPNCYWSIEDGIANYYQRGFGFKAGIVIKRIFFKSLYNYHLDIAFGHGKVNSDKSFRISPDLCVDSGNHTSSVSILKDYIDHHLDVDLSQIRNKYADKHTLVVSSVKRAKLKKKPGVLYKFHPQDVIDSTVEFDYVTETIPLEILLVILDHIRMVRFDVVSSSILNILGLRNDINVHLAFNYKGERLEPFFNELKENYPGKLEDAHDFIE